MSSYIKILKDYKIVFKSKLNNTSFLKDLDRYKIAYTVTYENPNIKEIHFTIHKQKVPWPDTFQERKDLQDILFKLFGTPSIKPWELIKE